MSENEEMKTNEVNKSEEVKAEAEAAVSAAVKENPENYDLKAIAEMLQEIRDNERKEMKYAKRQSVVSVILSLCCLVIVVLIGVAVFSLLPKVGVLIRNANTIIEEANDMMSEAQEVVTNLNKVTADLAQIDINNLFDNVNGLVVESQNSIGETMNKIGKIDFEGLNSAIQDLQAVISPLAKMFGH